MYSTVQLTNELSKLFHCYPIATESPVAEIAVASPDEPPSKLMREEKDKNEKEKRKDRREDDVMVWQVDSTVLMCEVYMSIVQVLHTNSI